MNSVILCLEKWTWGAVHMIAGHNSFSGSGLWQFRLRKLEGNITLLQEKLKMSDRYAAYSRLTLDYPSKRILRLTFNRPETYNSVHAETHTQLTNIWRDINDDPHINAGIVTGAGKAFSAGGEFRPRKSRLDNPAGRTRTPREA